MSSEGGSSRRTLAVSVDVAAGDLVATCDSGGFKGAGDNPDPGRPNRTPSLFVSTATIDSSKTLAAIELPAGASEVEAGTASLHLFAIATA